MYNFIHNTQNRTKSAKMSVDKNMPAYSYPFNQVIHRQMAMVE